MTNWSDFDGYLHQGLAATGGFTLVLIGALAAALVLGVLALALKRSSMFRVKGPGGFSLEFSTYTSPESPNGDHGDSGTMAA